MDRVCPGFNVPSDYIKTQSYAAFLASARNFSYLMRRKFSVSIMRTRNRVGSEIS